MGLFLVETWGNRLRWVTCGWAGSKRAPPNPHPASTLFPKGSTCRGQPDQHLLICSSLGQRVFVGRVWLGGESPPHSTPAPPPPSPLSVSKRSSVTSQPALYSLALLSTKERLRQRVGRYQRTGPTPHRSEHHKFCFVLISVSSSYVSHRSFTALMLHLHGCEGISAAIW